MLGQEHRAINLRKIVIKVFAERTSSSTKSTARVTDHANRHVEYLLFSIHV